MLIAAVHYEGSSFAPTPDLPSGWTQVATVGTNPTCRLYTRLASSAGLANHSFSWSVSFSSYAHAVMGVYRGVTSVVAAALNSYGTGSMPSIGAGTSSLLVGLGIVPAGSAVFTAPAGMTGRILASQFLADQYPVSGATGAKTVSYTGGTGSPVFASIALS